MTLIDYEAVFRAGPSPLALLSPDFVFRAVNDGYERISGRSRAELVGEKVFTAFPDDPDGADALRASLERVLITRQRHAMALQRYDVAAPGRPGVVEQRYWSVVNSPVIDHNGEVELILHRGEEVTDFLQHWVPAPRDPLLPEGAAGELAAMQAEVYTRSQEVQQANLRLAAAADITTAVLAGAPTGQVLELIATRAREIAGADRATVMVPDLDGERLVTAAAVGANAEAYRALSLPITGPPGEDATPLSVRVYRSGRSMIDLDPDRDTGPDHEAAAGTALAVPLGTAGAVRGVLAVSNQPDRAGVVSSVIHLLEPFAAQAAIVLELAERRRDAARLAVLEDRERIARDLNAAVVSRLFEIGIDLTAAVDIIPREEAARRVRHAVTGVDEVIRQLNSAVFAMRGATSAEPALRRRVQDLVTTTAEAAGVATTSRVDSRVDGLLGEQAGNHLLAVLREALSNVARHSGASHVTVTVDVQPDSAPGQLVARVEDDGRGLPASAHGAGMGEMAERAAALGGSLTLADRPAGGTVVSWQIPLTTLTGHT
ncbi:MAG TPA: PAS domain-containing protein [Amycolatopsis sp.]|jgi:PAS domain S-box-containing protein|nr:PAS domain-containing protein [Amycolatopsis sp.]